MNNPISMQQAMENSLRRINKRRRLERPKGLTLKERAERQKKQRKEWKEKNAARIAAFKTARGFG